MFNDMIRKVDTGPLQNAPVRLTVATVCSGTDAPIFGLKFIQDALMATLRGAGFEVKHLFSCEIEPAKQGFISRNLWYFCEVFRDVLEMAEAGPGGEATTARGSKAVIPKEPIDIFFAGCSCVDYSNLNTKKPSGQVPSLDKHLKHAKSGFRTKGGDDQSPETRPKIKLEPEFIEDLKTGLCELHNLDSSGESSRTFFAALKLIADMRPKLIILENVSGAPWPMYRHDIFPKIGYAACYKRLDSKEFYLPQTRVRGYLVAVDALRLGVEKAWEVAEYWLHEIDTMKRRASAPVTAFIGASDDPGTIQARAEMETKSSSQMEWSLSWLRHAMARQKKGLRDNENPFSHKTMRNGKLINKTFPSHAWLEYWDREVPRVVDLMDIIYAAVLRHEGFDLGYKAVMVDVSQNVDRCTLLDRSHSAANRFGIIGCITPSGMPVITELMRPITGTETLALQGLPADELVISTETQGELRDLAGNAMTVTVVGATTLCLLLSIFEAGVAPNFLNQIPSAHPAHGVYVKGPGDGEETLVDGRDSNTSSVTTSDPMLCLAVAGMARLCHCYRPSGGYLICHDCGTTACSKCQGSPVHSFRPRTEGLHRSISDTQGKVQLKNTLPGSLVLRLPDAVVQHGLALAGPGPYGDALAEVLGGNPVYYVDDIKTTEVVTVCYKATHSIARMVLSDDFGLRWYIYIAPWSPHAPNLLKEPGLSQPIARGEAVFGGVSDLCWSVWIPKKVNLRLKFSNPVGHAPAPCKLNFAPGEKAADLRDPSLQAWKQTVEKAICGLYTPHPNCGTPGTRLHSRQPGRGDRTGTRKVFMMWESLSLRDPEMDHFVWTHTMRRIDAHEYREILLHAGNKDAEPSKRITGMNTNCWSLGTFHAGHAVDTHWRGYWSYPLRGTSVLPVLQDSHALEPIGHSVRVSWNTADAIVQPMCHDRDDAKLLEGFPPLAVLTATLPASFPGSAPRLSKIDAAQTGGAFYVVPHPANDAFLKMFACITNELRKTRTPAHTLDGAFRHLNGEWVSVPHCKRCAITPPKVYARPVPENGEERATKRGLIEDPQEAAEFEKHFRDLSRAVVVAARLVRSPHDMDNMDVAFRLLMQPRALVSKALAHLLPVYRTGLGGRRVVESDAATFFTTVLDFVPTAVLALKPFAKSVQPCDIRNTVGIDTEILAPGMTDMTAILPLTEPARFVREKHKLRMGQRQAVDWMLFRERAPLDFIKREIEEEVISALNIRVVGKAEWINTLPFSCRGGLMAHDIGYGKTVISLALIDYQRTYDESESLRVRQSIERAWMAVPEIREGLNIPVDHISVRRAPLRAPKQLFVHLSATLVVVPQHITKQWASEAKKFLGLVGRRVLVIGSAAKFQTVSLDELEVAEIIIVGSSAFGESLLNQLEVVTPPGLKSRKGLSGRTLEAWYRDALRHHRLLHAYYYEATQRGDWSGAARDDVVNKLEEHVLGALTAPQAAKVKGVFDKQVKDSSRKFYKKQHKAKAKDNGDGGEPSKATPKRLKWKPSSLHACTFARIFWDECSYGDDNETGYTRLFVSNAVANAKWLVSGTPKLFNLKQVCDIASVFGIHIARPEPRMPPGLPAVAKGPELTPMSKSEQFYVLSSGLKSTALVEERHQQAESFVSAYFRANTLEGEVDIPSTEHVVPVHLGTMDSVHYYMLTQEFLDADGDYTALAPHSRSAVKLAPGDAPSKDSPLNARVLLALLACSVCERTSELPKLQAAIEKRIADLSGQAKLLWDKLMWLWAWIRKLKGSHLELRAKGYVAQVKGLCEHMTLALGGPEDRSFDHVGGKEAFVLQARTIARPSTLVDDKRPVIETWLPHFYKGWAENYAHEKALYTWADFFRIDNPAQFLKDASDDQVRQLAMDLACIKYKINPEASSYNPHFTDLGLGGHDLHPETRVNPPPGDVKDRPSADYSTIDHAPRDRLERFIMQYLKKKAEHAAQSSKQASAQSSGRDLEQQVVPRGRSGGGKGFYTSQLLVANVKFNQGTSVTELKRLLDGHLHGTLDHTQYRDGRAPPSLSRKLDRAIGAFGTSFKTQVDATRQEMKLTMVQLAKTMEDLKAYMTEARFGPEYAALTADDTDANGGSLEDRIQLRTCSACNRKLTSATESFLVVACGHFLCKTCKTNGDFNCPATGCGAFIRKRPVLQCSGIPPSSLSEPRTKTDAILDILRDRVPTNEYVVIFAQYQTFLRVLARALTAANIEFRDLATVDNDKVATHLEEFKEGKGPRILLLDIDNETSAGSNLTIANHVIFANSFVHQDVEYQARTMRQAKGRCVRTGQSKMVHIYHVISRGTIEDATLRQHAEHSPGVAAYVRENPLPLWMEE
ncbi:uncharacterized protein C8A04DRAFT_13559 [Dichotomopilus funicola]|uniref:RING-type domain-containing protein n=1 Tax=Dichotomopilus funicola TaxID=1934379 RepID=A0AAN6UZP6_9PEZI|nr:hypothetical protein C8A04DRAFT_13559 [Dichotomopilus funicola]